MPRHLKHDTPFALALINAGLTAKRYADLSGESHSAVLKWCNGSRYAETGAPERAWVTLDKIKKERVDNMQQFEVKMHSKQGDVAELVIMAKTKKQAIKHAWKQEILEGVTFQQAKSAIKKVTCQEI